MLCAQYPQYWQETIRALVVHSARWNATMLRGFNPHVAGQQDAVRHVLRSYGFGIPDLERACFSLDNQTTIICQNTIRPFILEEGESNAATNELHLHKIPLPTNILTEAGSAEATLRVTLSYFIEPNPGSKSVAKAMPTRNRYRYAGCALRFEVKPPTMSEEAFHAKLNAEVHDEDADLATEGFSDGRWAIGTRGRRIGGSLHQDIWRGSAADLALMNQIAVIPIKGWWATRKFPEDHECHNCHDRTLRYSLIISVEIAGNVPIYNAIRNLITVPVKLNS